MTDLLTIDQARERCLPGWNIRCNYCGTYGARWLPNERPGWGALALCPLHEHEYRHRQQAVADMQRVRFHQPGPLHREADE